MRKNAAKYASSDKAGGGGSTGVTTSASAAANDEDEWAFAGGSKAGAVATPKSASSPVTPMDETPTPSKAASKASTPGYSSALARSGETERSGFF